MQLTFEEAMKTPEAELWKATSTKAWSVLQDRKVFKLFPSSKVPAGHNLFKSMWVTQVKIFNTRKARVVAQV